MVLPDDLPALRAAAEGPLTTGGAFAHEFRIRRPDSGRERWLAARGNLVRGDGGARFVGLAWDVTDRREAEERHLLLMREVDHRAKNSLAVVQSVLALTRANDLSGFRTAVTGRIGAMARAHTLLARTRWDAVDLQALLQEELAVHLAGGRVTLAGPAAGLAPALPSRWRWPCTSWRPMRRNTAHSPRRAAGWRCAGSASSMAASVCTGGRPAARR
ncbi:HWE histidine kinase domain-containing protein [Siccirubricoccus deserti]